MKNLIIDKAKAICKADPIQFMDFEEEKGLTLAEAITVILTHDSEEMESDKVYDLINASNVLNEKLIERLNAIQTAIDGAVEGLYELHGEEAKESDVYLDLAGEIAPNETLLREIEGNVKFARKCDITGQGMNEGYCIGDGEMYIRDEKDFVKHLRDEGWDKDNDLSDEFLVNESYEIEYHYYTEWDDEDDFQYIMINGVLTEIEE